ncbi:MAG: elongation factor Ts [Bacteroidales bacterium]|nr:elongation factor Ts [Bacteroidales bacterium]
MSEITAADVAKLRKITGAGMMDCKTALGESNGDFEAAIEILRKKGQKIAAKREDRDANEGVVLSGVSSNGKKAAIVCLNCETDFVAKNADFIALTKEFLQISLDQNPSDLESLKALKYKDLTINDAVTEQIGKIGEKIELSYFEFVTSEQVYSYIHPGNKLATIVAFNKAVPEQVGKDIAMQIAAMNPVSIDKDDCSKEIIEKEIEIGKDIARQEGKPEEMLEKIALGKLNKFYKENTLVNQDFVKDNKMTIRQYLDTADKTVSIVSFKRFTLNR